ncbi:MAG: transporter [Anaerocolumna sp.]|nr:transporter [Anaerocolumna sp.]
MIIQQLMQDMQISRYRLSKISGIPWATLADIYSGKTTVTPVNSFAAETVGTYVQIHTAEELTSGKYVMIVNSGYAVGAYDSATKWLGAIALSAVDNKVTNPDNTLVWNGQLLGWRSVYELASITLCVFAIYLFFELPNDKVKKENSYIKIMLSIPPLLKQEKILRETIVFGATAFCTFNIFWVSLSFILEKNPYNYGSAVVGIFGFLGIAGALAAGYSGKLTNSKNVSLWNLSALGIMFLSFLILGMGWSKLVIIIMVTFTLDVGSRMNMTINQGRIYKLNPQNHSRLNSIYMVGYYLGGSIGSWISTMVYHSFHVFGITVVSSFILFLAYIYYMITNHFKIREEN